MSCFGCHRRLPLQAVESKLATLATSTEVFVGDIHKTSANVVLQQSLLCFRNGRWISISFVIAVL